MTDLDQADRALQTLSAIADDLDAWAERAHGRGFVRRQASRIYDCVEYIDAALGLNEGKCTVFCKGSK